MVEATKPDPKLYVVIGGSAPVATWTLGSGTRHADEVSGAIAAIKKDGTEAAFISGPGGREQALVVDTKKRKDSGEFDLTLVAPNGDVVSGNMMVDIYLTDGVKG
jgi:hypothetical protein